MPKCLSRQCTQVESRYVFEEEEMKKTRKNENDGSPSLSCVFDL